MSAPLDELYFVWLYKQVADPDFQDPSMTYWKLLKVLFTTQFPEDSLIPNDEDRAQDGKGLRLRFLDEEDIPDVDPEWISVECSVLELMVGLSRRLSFIADGEPHYWFWVLAENLGISQYNDRRRLARRHVADILARLIERDYEPSGHGGLFPLQNPREDQTQIDIWAQMSAYILEQS